MDIMKMIEIKEKYKFEILSPKIINSTHSFMNKQTQGVSVNNFLEVYLLLLTPKDFSRFLSKHTVDRKDIKHITGSQLNHEMVQAYKNKYIEIAI